MKPARSDRVWKALADPVRRRILDLLRERPRTTGELCGAFRVSRFATMKHLGVLERAGLIALRRRGRERWNSLNAVPLQEVCERWIEPHAAAWASALLRFRRAVEQRPGPSAWKGGSMAEVAMRNADGERVPLEAIEIEQEIEIAAPPARVFAALTGDLSAWWGAPYLLAPERAKAVVLEPRVGGQLVERWGDDEGALWATVTRVERDRRLDLVGPMGMTGAIHGAVSFSLTPRGRGTRLALSHRAFGAFLTTTRERYEAGWKDLLDFRLRRHVERGERHGLGREPAAPAGSPRRAAPARRRAVARRTAATARGARR